MAQFRQFCACVHDMFYNAQRLERVNRAGVFVNHSWNAWTLIYLARIWHVAPQLAAWSHAG
jgi:hypothetical protein